jgi:hypothetical protein
LKVNEEREFYVLCIVVLEATKQRKKWPFGLYIGKVCISAVILKYSDILKYISVAKGIKGNFWNWNRYKVKSVKAKVALKMSSTLEWSN